MQWGWVFVVCKGHDQRTKAQPVIPISWR